ncbi:hypothetical protein [Candidatus Leptofilum sp.]|uniref:hypothetical protein n=1 Tax=Candidatus Leptofilum sp. TaxID=3241576 RepID=UPI003B5C175F
MVKHFCNHPGDEPPDTEAAVRFGASLYHVHAAFWGKHPVEIVLNLVENFIALAHDPA